MAIPRIASYPMPQAQNFPTNKVNWTLDPSRAVLLVHDLQQYFLDFYDQSQAPIPELIQHCRQLIDQCHAQGIPVYYTAQPGDQSVEHRQLLTDFWGKGLAADPNIVQIILSLQPTAQDIVLTKWRYSAFKKSDFEQRMKDAGRDQLMICGVYAHIGCLLTAAEAFMLDIQAFLVGDALADFSLAEHEMALKYATGRCAKVVDTATVLTELQTEALTMEAV
ncbi:MULTISPECIES: isochorismatase family protein [unclassified Acinetobacter]|uniref:isochorismatase family protein n=1 Tax=unclassified Acinetobacter TaxID=196816 RepID=UPI0025752D67|nr:MULTISPECIES: isochorismatase family protein [unclassified Acinetobacter]MDM1757154.1 isochorismatase family protein [Acinetobacter sp. 256-1]MDM1760063.1 isochorismatase family protein [Acinetobacter sp. 251-1]